MTQLKFSREDKPKVEDKQTTIKELDKKRHNYYICRNEKCYQACAWILLTIGLCVIATTFYLAVAQKSYDTNTVVVDEIESAEGNKVSIEEIVFDKRFLEAKVGSGAGEWTDANINGRSVLDDIFGVIVNNLNGCQEKLCQIACSRAENVYSSIYDTMQSSSCPSIDYLILDRQDFPFKVLKNKWLPSNMSIHEVIVRASAIDKIKSDAFNAPIFMKTILMSWSHLDIVKVEGGALLGLYNLKYLTIDSHIRVLGTSFFQPVQTTLSHLKLNARLHLLGNQNFFGVSFMNNLEYLDFSLNHFKGTLDKNFFISTPNLKYLIIVEGRVSHIDSNAFENLIEKLQFVNLSKNLLTTLAPEVIQPILLRQTIAMISLSGNNWNCNCELKDLADLYRNFRIQFMDAVYCKAPHDIYGISIDEVDFKNCVIPSTMIPETVEVNEEITVATPQKTTTAKYNDNIVEDSRNDGNFLDSGEETSTEATTIFKMRCFNADSSSALSSSSLSSFSSSSASSSSSSSSSSSQSSNFETVKSYSDVTSASELDYLQFPAPEHEFELYLNTNNNTVTVKVEQASTLMVIWFSEQSVDEMTFSEAPFDYTCMSYQAPSLEVGPLMENTTYTFCLIPNQANEISPFNCLPLHVPATKQENIWISQDNKEFTIGMLCLIFLLSTITGALIAYFGVKTYPDLLEGSKNVLVVKKPDQACYVSTISETEYQKQASVKKKKASIKETAALKKQTSIKIPLPATPTSETPPPPFPMSVKDLGRLSSTASTCFEDTFPDYTYQEDNYETPKVCGNEYTIEQRCVPNKYGMSPGSPPPLPKRNSSNISESSTIVFNRFSSKFD